MLDTDTKRRIDTARDILVGKVPDPKSQVEQITIALIYKFMDDMDAESEELGGKRKFFTKEFARYGWAKLMTPGLGGHEMLGLYGEGISKMPENPGIPALFRDIFKNAYLPYRDPETLKAFLKVIDEFSYDHSERLGDAFEYLLSVLGSQGDAGQFRTPRHIIDFMVAVVDPKKNETVLDPACGTAGFLISSYKHILRANVDAKGDSTLTPDDKGRLAQNFKGYDISPDMVRLSLVNLYLHGFTDPHIVEYDTLTSQERWNEHADVILANPPFMSPKGGIKPHNRFSVQSKRSEVLFVDYMAEHLTPQGRAAIIVPEGIIFQSQSAYTQLRKMLVEEYLVAVVSLPAGVFNPYSGVKTSIIILDKSLARQSSTIAFFKVESDGYGLGAQRRTIERNDLPLVGAELAAYLQALRSKTSTGAIVAVTSTAQVVQKAEIVANGDYDLSAERYREEAPAAGHWRMVPLSEVCTKITDGSHNPPNRAQTGRLMLSSQNVFDNRLDLSNFRLVSEEDFERENQRTRVVSGDVLLTIVGTIGRSLVVTDEMPSFMLQRSVAVLGPDHSLLQPDFLARVLQSPRLQRTLQGLAQGVAQKGVYLNALRDLQIPLPPLEVQKEIVAEIDGYQKVINGARAVLDHYRPHIPIHPDWPMVPIKEVAAVESGYGFPLDYQGKTDEEIPFLKVSDMNLPGNEKEIVSWNHSVSRSVLRELKANAYPKGTVIFPKIGAAIATNKKRILSRESTYDNNVMGIAPDSGRLLPDFLHTYLLALDLSRWASESQPPSMRKTTVEAHEIPLPPLATQQAIVAEIDAEQALVAANHELITRFEKKIHATLARVWGEETEGAPE